MQQRFAAQLAYDGTAYYGFQKQRAGLPTIQGWLEAALESIARQPISCIGAGRTDTGVHASGQVISWQMAWKHAPDDLMRAMNHQLPPDIAIQKIHSVDERFHPRYDALSRTYIYKLYSAPTRDPFRDRFMWHCTYKLDIALIAAGLEKLLGLHNFATFGQPPQGTNTTRYMKETAVVVQGQEIHIRLCANAFLKRMVRSIVGTVVDVGRGKMSLAEFEAAFRSADRARSGPSAPPCGLVLTHVEYQTGW